MPEASMYVNFEEKTGSVLGISPKNTFDNCIAVPISKVAAILDGTESRRNFFVSFDKSQKKFVLGHKKWLAFDGMNIKNFIYEIPQKEIIDPDICLEQCLNKGYWRLTMSKSLIHNLEGVYTSNNKMLWFSITKKHDPNVLYNFFELKLSDLCNKTYLLRPFNSIYESYENKVSVFTSKIFDTYQLKRVTNE